MADGLNEVGGIEVGGSAGIDFGDDGGHPEGGIEEGEDREKRQVNFPGLDRVSGADEADLSVEVTVLVADPFRCTGGAAGEQYGGEIRVLAVGYDQGFRVLEVGAGEAGGERAVGGNAVLDGRKCGAEEAAEDACERDAHEGGGAGAGDAGEEVFEAHAGVDHDRYGTEGEEGEGGGNERQALADHQQCAVAGLHAGGGEAELPSGDFGGEFGEGEREVVDIAGRGAAAGNL